MADCQNEITPETFFRSIVRTDGSGNYAIAIKDQGSPVGWSSPLTCPDGLTWKDIVMMVYDTSNEAMKTITVT